MISMIERKTKVTVIDFYADWCNPCQQIKPEYERIAQFYDETKVSFCSCNVDRAKPCAQHFRVTSIPTFMVFYAGETISTVRGGELGQVQRQIDMAVGLL
uniref:Thioredoxin n=1 Tax=Lygus hesperus TaxID=30085 RepID=A0A0A9VY51_LYGHE